MRRNATAMAPPSTAMPSSSAGNDSHQGMPAVITLNSDIPPMLASRFNGRNTTLISVRLRRA
ncbi:hypothetical protein D3C85_1793820 [compost metagenome]